MSNRGILAREVYNKYPEGLVHGGESINFADWIRRIAPLTNNPGIYKGEQWTPWSPPQDWEFDAEIAMARIEETFKTLYDVGWLYSVVPKRTDDRAWTRRVRSKMYMKQFAPQLLRPGQTLRFTSFDNIFWTDEVIRQGVGIELPDRFVETAEGMQLYDWFCAAMAASMEYQIKDDVYTAINTTQEWYVEQAFSNPDLKGEKRIQVGLMLLRAYRSYFNCVNTLGMGALHKLEDHITKRENATKNQTPTRMWIFPEPVSSNLIFTPENTLATNVSHFSTDGNGEFNHMESMKDIYNVGDKVVAIQKSFPLVDKYNHNPLIQLMTIGHHWALPSGKQDNPYRHSVDSRKLRLEDTHNKRTVDITYKKATQKAIRMLKMSDIPITNVFPNAPRWGGYKYSSGSESRDEHRRYLAKALLGVVMRDSRFNAHKFETTEARYATGDITKIRGMTTNRLTSTAGNTLDYAELSNGQSLSDFAAINRGTDHGNMLKVMFSVLKDSLVNPSEYYVDNKIHFSMENGGGGDIKLDIPKELLNAPWFYVALHMYSGKTFTAVKPAGTTTYMATLFPWKSEFGESSTVAELVPITLNCVTYAPITKEYVQERSTIKKEHLLDSSDIDMLSKYEKWTTYALQLLNVGEKGENLANLIEKGIDPGLGIQISLPNEGVIGGNGLRINPNGEAFVYIQKKLQTHAVHDASNRTFKLSLEGESCVATVDPMGFSYAKGVQAICPSHGSKLGVEDDQDQFVDTLPILKDGAADFVKQFKEEKTTYAFIIDPTSSCLDEQIWSRSIDTRKWRIPDYCDLYHKNFPSYFDIKEFISKGIWTTHQRGAAAAKVFRNLVTVPGPYMRPSVDNGQWEFVRGDGWWTSVGSHGPEGYKPIRYSPHTLSYETIYGEGMDEINGTDLDE